MKVNHTLTLGSLRFGPQTRSLGPTFQMMGYRLSCACSMMIVKAQVRSIAEGSRTMKEIGRDPGKHIFELLLLSGAMAHRYGFMSNPQVTNGENPGMSREDYSIPCLDVHFVWVKY